MGPTEGLGLAATVTTMVRRSGGAAALGLTGIAGLHLVWGLGSSFLFRSRTDLADSVIGHPHMPGPAACHLVAVSLLGAAAITVDLPVLPPRVRPTARAVVATTLIGRGVIGFAGRTHLVSPGSTSPTFRRLDRAVYAPLCLVLVYLAKSITHALRIRQAWGA